MQSHRHELGEPALTKLEFFFRKLFRLAASRIDRLCLALNLSSATRQAIWSLFVAIIEDELHLRLFFRRHLLQIVIVVVYSVAKLFDEDRAFTQIIGVLQRQLGHSMSDDTFKHVWMGRESATSDIVQFYNQVFLPLMRDRIYHVGPNGRRPDHFEAFPMPPSVSSLSPLVPKYLGDRVTLELSPMKQRLTRPLVKSPVAISVRSDANVSYANHASRSDADRLVSSSPFEAYNVARRLDF